MFSDGCGLEDKVKLLVSPQANVTNKSMAH